MARREAVAPTRAPGSVLLQIGQRSMKRLWRQKVGIAPVESIAALAAPRRLSSGAPMPGPDVLRRALGALVGVGVPGRGRRPAGAPDRLAAVALAAR